MEPTRDRHATLVDLLDRVLDKGLVIDADIVISVAGIPLLGITLRAALAGMETMLEYGMMKEWDEHIRAYARKEGRKEKRVLAVSYEVDEQEPSLLGGETVLVKAERPIEGPLKATEGSVEG